MGAYSDAVLALSPTAYWRLGEASGAPQDSSGNGHHLTVVSGTPTYGATGWADDADTAITFNGTQRLSHADHADWDIGTSDFSISWVLRRNGMPAGLEQIIGHDGDTNLGQWKVAPWNTLDTIQLDLNGGSMGLVHTADLFDDILHHCVITFARASVATLWVDRIPVGTVSISALSATALSNATTLWIADRASADQKLTGTLDELAFWKSRLLTQTEIEGLFDAVPATKARPYPKAFGTWAEYVADGAVTIPGTPAAGDRMFLFATWKAFGTTASVTGWTPIGSEFADGSVASAANVGSVKVQAWYRDWQSGDSGPTIDWSVSPTIGRAVINVWRKHPDATWQTPLEATKAWPVTATTQTVSASATVAVPDGAAVMAMIGLRDDSAAFTRAATTGIDVASGIVWNGNYVERPRTHSSSTTGHDSAADLGHRMVTTGGTVTLRVTATISAVETGSIKWVVQGVDAPVVGGDVGMPYVGGGYYA